MSVPIVDPQTWVPLSVLAASLAGSAHCVSMCGGLVLASTRGPASRAAYHLGRLAGYLSLGAMAGFAGGRFLADSAEARWLGLGTAVFLGLGLLVAGFRVWAGKLPHFSIVPPRALQAFYQRTRGSAVLSGLLTALLPCGWLHVFVLGAVATRGAALGAGFLLCFWLGTLPALTAAPWLVDRVLRPFARRAPRLAAILLILSGVLTVGAKALPLIPSEQPVVHSCH